MRGSYTTHNTRTLLSQLDAKKLTPILPDRDQRKSVLGAVKGIASGEVSLGSVWGLMKVVQGCFGYEGRLGRRGVDDGGEGGRERLLYKGAGDPS